MREKLLRLVHRMLASRLDAETYQADFDDAAEMVVIARALRSHGYGARFSDTPLRLVVTIPRGVSTRFRFAATGGGR